LEDTIIRARGLSRSYTKYRKAEGLSAGFAGLFRRERTAVVALSDFDIDIRPGEIVGFLGPNGAGKTTLVKLLSGLLAPDAGELAALGHRPCRREAAFLQRITVVMGQRSRLWQDLPARDSFRLAQAVYGLEDGAYRRAVDRLSEALDARSFLDAPVRTLSLGERMRAEFIDAMLHGPDIAFLDEPTIGLDAPAQKRIREFLLEENRKRGMTILLTSHYMDDIRRLCPRSVLIRGGRKAYDGPTDAMFESVRERRTIVVRFDPADRFPTVGLGGEVAEEAPGRLVLSVRAEDARTALAELLSRVDPIDLSVEEEPIEDSVAKLYAGEGSHAAV
jgi:ABC-2 type transport system ATP-binding protein